MKSITILLSIIFLFTLTNAQEITQTVKGSITDKITGIPLFGATVLVMYSDPVLGSITDPDGNFIIENVPVGRQDIRVSYIGYEPLVLKETMVSSGKEVILQISLKESLVALDEVEIKANTNKERALNPMATLSARQLSVEEASRYAGAFDDPTRLAGSFAGVAQQIGHNGIVIRGNAPKGMLWQMEGIRISNPTHFANYVAFGAGGITALSSQVLANSDFYTGAFPAQYGNALSGVFDLNLKTGNPDKREYTFQLGGIGIDFSSEGPFVKGKKATYLFNYRYSTFALIAPLLPEEAGLIEYQDLSFKTNFPTQKWGAFSIWGLGALDYQGRDAKTDPAGWETESDMEKLRANLFMGVAGFSHKIILNRNTLLKSSLAVSGNGMDWSQDRIGNAMEFVPKEDVNCYTWNYAYSGSLSHKFSAGHSNKTGLILTRMNYDIDIRHAETCHDPLIQVADDKGYSYLYQMYSQSKFEPGEKWDINFGIHAQYFALNGNHTIEPRAGVKWDFKPGQSLAFGYGLHSQLEMITFYLTQTKKDGVVIYPNMDMDFAKAHHFVLSYDRMLSKNTHIKIEPYYQHLFHVPVKPANSFSLQNIEKEWIITDSLLNKGSGVNIGIDVTLERFLNKGFYYLVTASVFDSRYKGGDGIWRNARYNRNYVLNILAGKEWSIGRKKSNILSLNAKLTLMGGDRYDPLRWDESMEAGKIIYDDTKAFEMQKPHAQVLSLNFSYRINKKKHSGIWSVSLLNILGQEEFNGYHFNEINGSIEKEEDVLMIPNVSYKIEF